MAGNFYKATHECKPHSGAVFFVLAKKNIQNTINCIVEVEKVVFHQNIALS